MFAKANVCKSKCMEKRVLEEGKFLVKFWSMFTVLLPRPVNEHSRKAGLPSYQHHNQHDLKMDAGG